MIVASDPTTFYECVAAGMGHRDDETIHTQTLLHFAQIMFLGVNGTDTIVRVIERHASLVLNKNELTRHPAIALWIERLFVVKRCEYATPAACYEGDPKWLKAMALQFIYYHRKRHRILCRFMFAQLVADVCGCNIGIEHAPSAVFRWFYPIEGNTYYLHAKHPRLLIRHEKGRGFCLLGYEDDQQQQQQQLEAPDRLEVCLIRDDDGSMDGDDADVGGPFSLRKAITDPNGKNFLNKHIGHFAVRGRVHIYAMDKIENVTYQIYPGDETKTYYSLPPLHTMFIFSGSTLIAQNDAHDNYAYFKLSPEGAATTVTVVCARNQKEAEGLILGAADGK